MENNQCPRRMPGFNYGTDVDEWRPGDFRWGRHETDAFPEGFEPPRTCSFCGGVHPEDVIALLEKGWEVEATTKGYKAYIQPPGFHESVQRRIENGFSRVPGEAPFVTPIPPVKLYTMHFTQAQIDRLNAAITKNLRDKYGVDEAPQKPEHDNLTG